MAPSAGSVNPRIPAEIRGSAVSFMVEGRVEATTEVVLECLVLADCSRTDCRRKGPLLPVFPSRAVVGNQGGGDWGSRRAIFRGGGALASVQVEGDLFAQAASSPRLNKVRSELGSHLGRLLRSGASGIPLT